MATPGHAAAAPRGKRPRLTPPFRFGTVEAGLYRSAHPTPANYDFVRTLGLKTMVSLVHKLDSDLEAFAAKNGIALVHLPVARAFDTVTLTHELAAQALEVLVDAARLPCLVHCYDGANTTGLVVVCLRKLQSIAAPFAVAEFERFQRSDIVEPMTDEERMFVESFRHDVRAPEATPPWLWDVSDDSGGGGGAEQGGPQLRRPGGPVGGAPTPAAPRRGTDASDADEAMRPDSRSLRRVTNESPSLAALALEGMF